MRGTGFYLDPVQHSCIRRVAVRCEPRAEPDTGLFMSLSPHRVPDRSHPCQHQSHGREFPLMETLVTAVYSTAVITLCLAHRWTSFENSKMSNAEEFQRCLWNVCYSSADCLGTGLSPADSFHSTSAASTVEPIPAPSKSVALSWVLDRLYLLNIWHANVMWYLNFSKKDFLRISLFIKKIKIK